MCFHIAFGIVYGSVKLSRPILEPLVGIGMARCWHHVSDVGVGVLDLGGGRHWRDGEMMVVVNQTHHFKVLKKSLNVVM